MPTPQVIPPNGPAVIPYDGDGFPVSGRSPIAQATAGGTSVAPGAADTALTAAAAAGERHFIQQIIAQCIVAPTADGIISIKDAAGGNVLFKIQAETAMAQGTQLKYEFKTPLRGAIAGVISIDSAANTGTWVYFIDGFDMNSAAAFGDNP